MPGDGLRDVLERLTCAVERIADLMAKPSEFSVSPLRTHIPWNVDGAGPEPDFDLRTDESTLRAEMSAAAEDVPDFGAGLLEEFLNTRGVTVRSVPDMDRADTVLDSLSVLIGTRFAPVKPLIDEIKRHLHTGAEFTLDLRKVSQHQRSEMCHVAAQLHRVALLAQYHYRKSPKCQLVAAPTRLPKGMNFLSGGWLERFIRHEMHLGLRTHRPRRAIATLMNARITLPTGEESELDALLMVEGGEVFWVEAKTGNYQQYIEKYARISEILGLDVAHSILVADDINQNLAKALTALFGLTIFPVSEMRPRLRELLMRTKRRAGGEGRKQPALRVVRAEG